MRVSLRANARDWTAGRNTSVLLALLFGLTLITGAAGAQVLTLTRDEAIDLARRAWLAGDVVLAWSIARPIVAKDPDDVEALMLLSASNAAMGHPGAAFALGRRAWWAAAAAGRPPALRYEIAVQTARTAMIDGKKRSAAFWLGRAVSIAPSEQTRAQSLADLGQVRSQLPSGFSASLNVSPTNNLNNGGTTGLMIIDDQVIPGGSFGGWSVAHGGVVTRAGVEASHSLGVAPSGTARNTLVFGVTTRLHPLSPDEAAANPGLDARDLDLWRVAARWTQERLISGPAGEARAPLRFGLEASQRWFGGAAYAPSLRAELDVPLTRAEAAQALTLAAVLERQWQDAPSGVVQGARLHLEGRQRLNPPWGEGQMVYALGGTLMRSGWVNSTNDALDASLSLDPGLRLGQIGTVLGLGASWRNHDAYSLGLVNVTKGRTDQGLWLRAGLTLGEIRFAGLTPTLTLQRQMSWPNISKYQTAATTLYPGLSSDF